VISREYFLRQAATLVEFARSTNDHKLAAALIEKASNLLSQIDESGARQDPSPQAPDGEPENGTGPFPSRKMVSGPFRFLGVVPFGYVRNLNLAAS